MKQNKHLSPTSDTNRFTVNTAQDGMRLDRFLADALSKDGISREKIKRAIKENHVSLNNTVCSVPKTKLTEGMLVSITLEVSESSVVPEEGELDVVHKDQHLLVVNKPSNLTVHPCPSCPEGTLVHRLVHHFPELGAMEGFRPGIVHRIDKDTSGLLMVALTEGTRITLSEAFAQRTIHKKYIALVHGVPAERKGSIEEPIARHPSYKTKMAVVPGGKEAQSAYTVLYADPSKQFSVVEVRIFTGRTHQIRVHMSHIGHPLWGDKLYGGGVQESSPFASVAKRQMLHAWNLSFEHPVSKNELSFTCPPPKDFLALIEALSQSMQKVVLTGMPGCGKSALRNLLQETGIPTWSADTAVHELYAVGGDGWHLLKGRYGEQFVPDTETPVDRKALFHAMQNSQTLRKEVEHSIHPLVQHNLEEFWKKHRHAAITVAEIPLFHETGWHTVNYGMAIDAVVGVRCPRNIRASRLQETRGWSEEVLASMEAWQWADKDKINACDIVVDNSGSLEALTKNCHALINSLTRRRRERVEKIIEKIQKLWS